jgi:hypothetical protein
MPVSPDEAKRLHAPVSGDGIEANPLGAPRVSGHSHLELGSCHVARRQASGFAGHQVRPISAAESCFRSSSRRSFPCGSRRRRCDLKAAWRSSSTAIVWPRGSTPSKPFLGNYADSQAWQALGGGVPLRGFRPIASQQSPHEAAPHGAKPFQAAGPNDCSYN